MSCNKKLDAKENDENLLNTTRKRAKPGIPTKAAHLSRKLARTETTSSPSFIPLEVITEMGIGMLDSEESSSSVTSAMALAISAAPNADENSNESTPNLDAPKYCYQTSASAYRQAETTLDSSKDNLTISFTEANGVPAVGGGGNAGSGCAGGAAYSGYLSNHTNNNNSNPRGGERTENANLHRKKTSAAGNVIASPGKNIRSPLATVSCNKFVRTATTTASATVTSATAAAAAPTFPTPSAAPAHAYPLPSTSQQAHLLKRHQQQQLEHAQWLSAQQQHQQQPQQQHERIVPYECFFLFRNQIGDGEATARDHTDYFGMLSDEIILQIFKWLPKKALMRSSSVCRRFNRCAKDESLWTRLDMGGRILRSGALEHILTRGVVILRLAQSELTHPVFDTNFLLLEADFSTKLQYLDLSLSAVTKRSLKMLLARCRHLKKLSLEHVPVSDEICNEIAANTNLEALNLAMCEGLEAWSVRKIMEALTKLNSLNISWTSLSVDAVTSLVTTLTPNLMRLNVAGCRKTMFDSHLSSLVKRCPQLLELDLSDCTGLTGNVIAIICKFKMLEYLSLSRCYLIPVRSLMELSNLSTLTYLDVFSMLNDTALETLEQNFPYVGLNKFIHSSVARPTVGSRRTSIWGLRTRD